MWVRGRWYLLFVCVLRSQTSPSIGRHDEEHSSSSPHNDSISNIRSKHISCTRQRRSHNWIPPPLPTLNTSWRDCTSLDMMWMRSASCWNLMTRMPCELLWRWRWLMIRCFDGSTCWLCLYFDVCLDYCWWQFDCCEIMRSASHRQTWFVDSLQKHTREEKEASPCGVSKRTRSRTSFPRSSRERLSKGVKFRCDSMRTLISRHSASALIGGHKFWTAEQQANSRTIPIVFIASFNVHSSAS